MSIWAIVEGNLAKTPEKKTVNVKGEQQTLVELLVFSDVGRRVNEEWVQDEDKSGLVEVTIWQEKLGEAVFKHLKKGARVKLEGDLHLQRYKDRNGDADSILRMSADSVTLALYRIESIAFKASRRSQQAAEAGEQVAEA